MSVTEIEKRCENEVRELHAEEARIVKAAHIDDPHVIAEMERIRREIDDLKYKRAMDLREIRRGE